MKHADLPASYSALLQVYISIRKGAISIQGTKLRFYYLRFCQRVALKVFFINLFIGLIAGFFGLLYLKSPTVGYLCVVLKFLVQVTQRLHAKHRSKLHLNKLNCAFHIVAFSFIQLNSNCVIYRSSQLFLHCSELSINRTGALAARYHKTCRDLARLLLLNVACETAQAARFLLSCLCGGQCQFL